MQYNLEVYYKRHVRVAVITFICYFIFYDEGQGVVYRERGQKRLLLKDANLQ